MISFSCDNCGKCFRVPSDKGGKTAKCPGCGHLLHIPVDSQAPPPLEVRQTGDGSSHTSHQRHRYRHPNAEEHIRAKLAGRQRANLILLGVVLLIGFAMPVIHYNPITQEKRSEFINLTTLTNDAAPASVKVLCLIPGVAGLGLLILQTVSKHPVRGIVIIFMSLTPFIIALTDLRIVDAVTQIGARLPPDAEFATLLGFLGLFVAPVLLLAGIRSRSYRPDSQAAYWFGAIGAGFWFAFLTIPALPAEGGHIFMIAPVKMLGKTGLERLAIGLIALLACTSASALVCVANGPSGNTMKARNQANLSFWTLVVGQIVWMLFLASAVIESFPDIVGSIKSLCLFGGMFLLLPTGITDIVVGRAHHHHQESVQTDHPHTPPEDTPRRMV